MKTQIKVFFTLDKPKRDSKNYVLYTVEGKTYKYMYDKVLQDKELLYLGKDKITGERRFRDKPTKIKTDVLALIQCMALILETWHSEKRIRESSTGLEIDFHLEKGSSWRILAKDFVKLRWILNKHPKSYIYGLPAVYSNEKEVLNFFRIKDSIIKELELKEFYVELNLLVLEGGNFAKITKENKGLLRQA